MFDIYTVNRNVHACVNFLTRVEHAEVLVLEFDCFVVGRDGVTMVKYNATSSATAMTDTMTAVYSDYTTTTTVYDSTIPDLDITVLETTNNTARNSRRHDKVPEQQ